MRPAARDARSAEPSAHAAAPGALLRDVVVLGAVWGSSVMFQRMAVAEVAPLPLVVLRLAAALLFFVPFLPRVWRGLTADRRRFVDVCLVGAINPCLCGILSAQALLYASSGLVGPCRRRRWWRRSRGDGSATADSQPGIAIWDAICEVIHAA